MPVVETWAAVHRLPPEQRQMLWAGHPSAAMYAEIARDVLPTLFADAAAPLVELAFESALVRGDGTSPGSRVVGDCSRITRDCVQGEGCYRWNPRQEVCYVQRPLSSTPKAAQVSARFLVREFPADFAQVLALFEDFYGTGVYLEISADHRVQLFTLGPEGQETRPICLQGHPPFLHSPFPDFRSY